MPTKFSEAIDRNSFVPLYEQIKAAIRRHIAKHNLKPGDMLPSERELCEHLSVSRITVVKALDELTSEGLIERLQGSGTRVSSLHLDFPIQVVRGLSESLREQGAEVHSRVLSHKTVSGDARTHAFFGSSPRSLMQFVQFRRLWTIGDHHVVLSKITVPASLGKRLLDHNLEDVSFYGLFEQITGLPIVRAEDTFALISVEEEARVLQVNPGSTHFLRIGFAYQQGDMPIEISEAIYRGDIFTFHVRLDQIVVKDTLLTGIV